MHKYISTLIILIGFGLLTTQADLKDDFSATQIAEVSRDRVELEKRIVEGAYGDVLRHLNRVADILEQHGKDAIAQPWSAGKTTAMANAYGQMRDFVVFVQDEHDTAPSTNSVYVPTLAELPN